mgnify:FL=1
MSLQIKNRDSENKNPIERQKKEIDYHGKRNQIRRRSQSSS